MDRITISLVIIFLGMILPAGPKSRKAYAIILCIILILQNAMRPIVMDMESSNDTVRYYWYYQDLLSASFLSVLKSFSLFGSDYESRDLGFPVFIKLTQLITSDFRLFLLIVASIIVIPIVRLVYKMVPTIAGMTTAFLIYEALFASFFETGIRQTIAMGLVLMSVGWVMEKKPVKFLLWILMASTIHTSALVFAPIILFQYIKNQKKMLLCILCLTPVLMLYANQLIAWAGSGTMYESYAVDSEDNMGTPVFSALLFCIGLGALAFYRRITSYVPRYKQILFPAIGLAIALMPSSWVDSNFIRIVFYYALFILPLVPICIESVSQKGVRHHRIPSAISESAAPISAFGAPSSELAVSISEVDWVRRRLMYILVNAVLLGLMLR